MKEFLSKTSAFLKLVFGYSIMITLFSGCLTFLGFVAALIIGGDAAAIICDFIYKTVTPIIVYLCTSTVILGIIAMYLSGELALTIGNKKKNAPTAENGSSSNSADSRESKS